ncbi:MAG: bifunctional adenosylcobinamide kinase/adenosylcobinamide-phosphate guanylyltransferase [Clostridiales Family XIII bacterium]|jgi:adenosylcobinamide kinase/adenosylcobinamide-phosphate guanylyltransferase|nr:bifunctional adenosylcobinamide kinase/adenosylcobinamide-phosphate guanylyltransferase [Clostridiales Family XIII bacterium]
MKILLTGGSANGKSTYAEQLATSFAPPLYYLATMRPYGEESAARIERHKGMRAEKGFETVECDTGIGSFKPKKAATVLLECLCNLTANEMFDDEGKADEAAEGRILEGIGALEARCANLIVVTNDVGGGVNEQYNEGTRLYVETLGRLNAALAARFDVVCELVCGIPLVLKGKGLL